MRAMDTDAKSSWEKSPKKCLEEAEKSKKNMYLEAFLQQHWHFSQFFASVDGQLGAEETATLKRISSRLASKWRQSYSKTCRYVMSRIAFLFMNDSWIKFPTLIHHKIATIIQQSIFVR